MIRREQNFTASVPAGKMWTREQPFQVKEMSTLALRKNMTGIWGRKNGKTSKQTNEGQCTPVSIFLFAAMSCRLLQAQAPKLGSSLVKAH